MILYNEDKKWCMESDGIILNDEIGNYILASVGSCLVELGLDFWNWKYPNDSNKARYTLVRLKVYEDKKGLFVRRNPYGKFYLKRG